MKYTIDLEYRELLRHVLKTGKLSPDPNRQDVYRQNIPYYQLNVPIDTVPAISIKKIFPQAAMKELSMFMRGETDIRNYWAAGINFWTQDWFKWKGHKTGVPIEEIKDRQSEIKDESLFDMGKIYPYQYRQFQGSFDQMADMLRKMIERPMDSSILVNIWNPAERKEMCLAPCHYGINVNMEKIQYGSRTGYGFHLSFTLRSSDLFLGLPINIMYYFYLAKILERVTGHKLLSLTGHLNNVHLYDNAIDSARDVVLNKPKHVHPLKNLEFDPYLDEPIKELEDYGKFFDSLPLNAVKLTDYQSYRHYKVPMLPYS